MFCSVLACTVPEAVINVFLLSSFGGVHTLGERMTGAVLKMAVLRGVIFGRLLRLAWETTDMIASPAENDENVK